MQQIFQQIKVCKCQTQILLSQRSQMNRLAFRIYNINCLVCLLQSKYVF